MGIIGIGLYVKNSVEAVQTYIKAFDMELGYHVLNKDGSYFHSELMKGEEPQLAVVESDVEATGYHVQLGFTFDTKEELEKAYNILSEGGIIKMEPCELPWSPHAAEVVDRFGIDWYLTVPQHRPEDDFTPEDMEK